MFELKNKVALVTGAERGMGKTHCLALAKQGAIVAVTGLNQENCQEVADEIISQGGEAIAFKMDVTKKSEIEYVIA
ncbi:SDR family NAD(P)-dependent oxidoreductase, partial [Candidatus Peregrinibacteria bacterium]|nr:SDR family NAD(P)-dependent oxidoreductase [Candidatus Peregrinibacteria bacterium]